VNSIPARAPIKVDYSPRARRDISRVGTALRGRGSRAGIPEEMSAANARVMAPADAPEFKSVEIAGRAAGWKILRAGSPLRLQTSDGCDVSR